MIVDSKTQYKNDYIVSKGICSEGVKILNIGERVISIVDIVDSVQMFPAKYETPKTTSISSGSKAIIEEVYPSGWGIVKFENGKKVLVSKLKEKFVIA